MKKPIYITAILVLVIFVFNYSCKKDDPPPPDPNLEVMNYIENNGEIGQAGGSIILYEPNSDLHGAGIIVPSDALENPVNISFSVNNTIKPPSDSTAIVISFLPKGLTFKQPIQILLPYKGSGTPTAWYLNSYNDELEKLKIISNSGGIVKAETDHFSDFSAVDDGVYADINLYNIGNKIKCKVMFGGYSMGNRLGIGGIRLNKATWLLSGGRIWNSLQFLSSAEALISPANRTWVSLEVELVEDLAINKSLETKRIAIKRVGSEVGKMKAEFFVENKSGSFESIYQSKELPDNISFHNNFSGDAVVVEFDESIDPNDPNKKYFIKTSWVLCDNAAGNGGLSYYHWSNKYKVTSKTEPSGIWTSSSMSKTDPDKNNSWVTDEFEVILLKPTVITNEPTNPTSISATVGGNVTSDGGATVTERGVYYGLSQNPETTGTKVVIGNSTGSFSKTITGLTSDKTYYVKAYAINSEGISYGEQKQFKTEKIVDTEKPVVTITSLTENQTISGTFTFKAQATDNVGVDRVEFKISKGSEGWQDIATDKTATNGNEYSIDFDTKNYENGTYALVAVAFDVAGNEGFNTLTNITIKNDSGGTIVTSTLTDTRGSETKTYKTVKIGNQEWMAENLAYLPAVYPPTSSSYTEPRYYVYDYNGSDVSTAKQQTNYTTYGVLYNLSAAKAACPYGWHLPTDEEWKQLCISLGMSEEEANAAGWRGTNEGAKLKNTAGWDNNGNGTNESKFSALPGGILDGIDHKFYWAGSFGSWWSNSESFSSTFWVRYLSNTESKIYRSGQHKSVGQSVRCIKNQ